jgi:hypothetical protein
MASSETFRFGKSLKKFLDAHAVRFVEAKKYEAAEAAP